MARASDPMGAHQQHTDIPLYVACIKSVYAICRGIKALPGRVGQASQNRLKFGIESQNRL
jgi:hypothetical protein